MKKSKRKISIKPIISLIMMIICAFASIYSLYSISLLSGIETKIRVILSLIIIVLVIALILAFLKTITKRSSRYILYPILGIIYSVVLITFGHYIIKTYKVVDRFSNDATTYSSSLVTLKKNDVDELKEVDGKIGIVKDKENMIGYKIPKEVIKKEKLDVKVKEYDSYIDLITALYDKKIDYAFLPTNYTIMFSSYEGADFSKLDEDTKIIYTKEKKVENKTNNKKQALTKPFTILLMGVDSENEEIAGSSFNGDSLMLITFNPNTLNATLLSIPRDTYVPIACFAGKKKNKITHAAWYGEECMINTIQDFTGINIDYYVKINFKGLVKIVDTLGGVDVDVPYSFCEQNSDRKFGNDTVYVEKGFQTLNGEQALAFSRNRHPWPQYCGAKYSNYVSNDFIRGQNQQTVLKAILNKVKENGNLDTVYKLLDAVSTSMETNITTSQILSLYNVGKDVIAKSRSGQNIDNIIGMQRLYLSGKDAYIYDPGSGLRLYNFVLYDESLQEVTKAMKINLELQEPEMIKEFSFNIDEEYEEKVIGKMHSGTTSSYSWKDENKKPDKESTKDDKEEPNEKEEKEDEVKVPNFVGWTYAQAKREANKLGLYVNPGIEGAKDTDIVTKQDTPAGTTIKKGLMIKLTLKSASTPQEPEDNTKPDNGNNDNSAGSETTPDEGNDNSATGDTEGKEE